jgi:hypothetical protein
MSPLQAVYYRAPDGSEPVSEFLQSLGKKRRVSLRNQIARLNLLSDEVPHLPFPHSSQVDGELRESEVDTAKARWQDFRARMNRKPRRPPRAAGHDAP